MTTTRPPAQPAADPSPSGAPRLHTVDSFTEELQRVTAHTRERGRDLAGYGGEVDKRPFRTVLRAENARMYPLIALFCLGASGALHAEAFSVLRPDIGRAFGLGPGFFSVLGLLGQVTALLVPLAVARTVQNHPRRAVVVLLTTGLWCVLTMVTGLTTAVAGLALLMALDSANSAAYGSVSSPLLIDLFPPRVRVRVISVLRAGGILSGLAAPALVALLTGVFDLNWRGVFIVLGALAGVFFLASTGLRDPGFGHYDTQRIQQTVRDGPAAPADPDLHGDTTAEKPGTAPPHERPAPPRLSIGEALRRILLIRSMRLMFWAGAAGAVTAPAGVYLTFYYTDHFNLGTTERALIQLATGAAGFLSLLVLGPVGDRIYQRSPKRIFQISGALSLLGIVLSTAQIFMPTVTLLVMFSVLGALLGGLSGPAMTLGTMSIVPAPLRPHVGAVSALFGLGGSALGTVLLGGLQDSMGVVAAITFTSLGGVAGTVLTMVSGRFVAADLDSMVDGVIEEETVASIHASGGRLPMISCRGLQYSYSGHQVLFGVDFQVDEGEMVALLGTNGAGKSTLLRAVSGLGLPDRGSIRFQGHDITYHDAERRTAMGIVQVPGGRAVFDQLSVVDNLRCHAYTLRDRKAVERGIDEAFGAFPRLAERRNQPAAVLSGGEQQMLALAKALILRPKLLLIDELSLGLAPVVIEQLLQTVRRINASGTAVVLVEQSVNIALNLVERAYFMERGQIRFQGPSADLLQQTDLLRAVFLSGAVVRDGSSSPTQEGDR